MGDTRETKKGDSSQTTKGDIRQTKKENSSQTTKGDTRQTKKRDSSQNHEEGHPSHHTPQL